MKVIKEGRVPERIRRTIRVKCYKCKAELEVNPSDLRFVPRETPIEPQFYEYECPCCQHDNELLWNDLPYGFTVELSARISF